MAPPCLGPASVVTLEKAKAAIIVAAANNRTIVIVPPFVFVIYVIFS
jgi:oxalate decarboxylase/phosphoglucose isomerase-like protein (cupin superfamily)